MYKVIFYIKVIFNCIRCFPHLILYKLHPNRKIIDADMARWLKIKKKKYGKNFGLIYLLGFLHEYRNLYYKRVGLTGEFLLSFLCPPFKTLYLDLDSSKIGEGLFLQHGYACGISAESIGKNCWINHLVTVGYMGKGKRPVIGDNVKIRIGATVLGDITIGNNVVIGASALVLKDVPDNAIVAGIPAKIIGYNNTNPEDEEY